MERTPLFSFHEKHGSLTEYVGFEMPLYYKGPVGEHLSVRTGVGIFDVSHMGRILVTGTQVGDCLGPLLTNDCTDLDPMLGQHAFFCNPSGGIIDDVMVFRLEKNEFLLVVNAINREKDLSWMDRNKHNFKVKIIDLTDEVPMVAVQGPKAVQVLQELSNVDLLSVQRFHSIWAPLDGKEVLVSRTGYTGEDGFEIYVFEKGKAQEVIVHLWERILEAGKDFGIETCGLAARDTLRLEAGLCLYGNELDEKTTPIEAGLTFGVEFNERQFVGREGLLKQIEEGVKKVRVGLKTIGRGIPRKGMEIWMGIEKIGFITSGTFSPILKTGIGMGYVPPERVKPKTKVSINIRGKPVEAEIVKFPFYSKDKYGWRRKVTPTSGVESP